MNKTPEKKEMQHRDEWIVLFLAGLTAFNWPFMEVFRDNHYYYIFALWLGFIVLLFLICISDKASNEE